MLSEVFLQLWGVVFLRFLRKIISDDLVNFISFADLSLYIKSDILCISDVVKLRAVLDEFLLIGWTKRNIFLFYSTLVVVLVIVCKVRTVERLTEVTVGLEVIGWRAVLFDVFQLASIKFIECCFIGVFVGEVEFGSFLDKRFFESFGVIRCFTGIFREWR